MEHVVATVAWVSGVRVVEADLEPVAFVDEVEFVVLLVDDVEPGELAPPCIAANNQLGLGFGFSWELCFSLEEAVPLVFPIVDSIVFCIARFTS